MIANGYERALAGADPASPDWDSLGWADPDTTDPVVRPYALTGGRTHPSGRAIDLVALVSAIRGAAFERADLEPEHITVLRNTRLPISLADLASDLDLPLGVVRILVADLRDRSLVMVHQPAAPGLSDIKILREVADALRRL